MTDNEQNEQEAVRAAQAYEEELQKLFNSRAVPASVRRCFVRPADELRYWSPALRREDLKQEEL